MIALVGNPFSSRYARARRAGPAAATDHVAMNVSLRGPRGLGRFCLTERGDRALARSGAELSIGDSSWKVAPNGELLVRLDERTTPWPGRLTGRVRVQLGEGPEGRPLALDDRGRHRWWPLAPLARAEVSLSTPRIGFAGSAYVDAQQGDEPLEAAFRRWTWSRDRSGGAARVAFDVERRDGSRLSAVRCFGAQPADGEAPLPSVPLSRSAWGLSRAIRARGIARVRRSLEDGPCYARALVETERGDGRSLAVHEVLDLDRLQAGWVRFLMPFRTRRESRS